jgi:hypothetical protein
VSRVSFARYAKFVVIEASHHAAGWSFASVDMSCYTKIEQVYPQQPDMRVQRAQEAWAACW